MQFIVLIKSFQFKKAAMQDHFNRKDYMDSDNFPKSEFKGAITDPGKVDFKKTEPILLLLKDTSPCMVLPIK